MIESVWDRLWRHRYLDTPKALNNRYFIPKSKSFQNNATSAQTIGFSFRCSVDSCESRMTAKDRQILSAQLQAQISGDIAFQLFPQKLRQVLAAQKLPNRIFAAKRVNGVNGRFGDILVLIKHPLPQSLYTA